MNFIQALPNEILCCIFDYICNGESVAPLTVSHVCRAWYQAAIHYTLLWRYITLNETVGSLKYANLCLTRATGNTPLELTIRCKCNRSHLIESYVVDWLRNCPVGIKFLKVLHVSKSRTNYLLTILPFTPLSALEKFELMGLNEIDLDLKAIADVLAKAPLLKSLSLSGVSGLRSHPSMKDFAGNITHLTIGLFSHIDYISPLRVDAALEIIACCNGLLVLECFSLADEEDIEPPVTILSNLSSLTIGDGPETCRLLLYLAAPRLQSFKLVHGKILNEEEQEIFMPGLPGDQEIFPQHFTECFQVFYDSSNAPRITKLIWEDCIVGLEVLENCSHYLRSVEEVEISGITYTPGNTFPPYSEGNPSEFFPNIKSLIFYECSLNAEWYHAIELLYRTPQAASSKNCPRMVFRQCTGVSDICLEMPKRSLHTWKPYNIRSMFGLLIRPEYSKFIVFKVCMGESRNNDWDSETSSPYVIAGEPPEPRAVTYLKDVKLMAIPGSSDVSNPLTPNDTFKALKLLCVPLLSNSLLNSQNIQKVSSLLSQLDSLLDAIHSETTLSPSSIEYVFFPISHILKRNSMSSIPDVVMEKLMLVLAKLVEEWWWTCPVEVWDQLLMLAAAIFCGIDSETAKGKNKTRDDDTKRATACCLKALLRRRVEGQTGTGYDDPDIRFKTFTSRANQPKIISILGQTLTSLLDTAQSQNRSLQMVSFELIKILLDNYFSDQFFPSVLPGVVSAMVKVALGRQESKGWSPGDNVVEALDIMHTIILAAIRDEVCVASGAIRTFSRLDELSDNVDSEGRIRLSEPSKAPSSPFSTPRTSVWLRATTSQLHIAINTLSPLLHHPNPVVPSALARFAYTILSNTAQTFPEAQQHLLTYLLSLSTNAYPDIEKSAKDYLLQLFSSSSPIHHQLLQVLFRVMRDRLISLPQLVPAHNDVKVEQIAKQVAAACYLADAVPAISDGISKLLGPIGGIEKWGWSFLSVLQFIVPPLFVSTVRPAVALLEGAATQLHPFPELNMKFIELRPAQDALDTMFRALGKAAGADAIFAVEWFVGIGLKGRSSREVSALWCASKLLEGMGDVSLSTVEATSAGTRSQSTLDKTSRWIARTVAQLWDSTDDDDVEVKERREDASSMEVSSEADNHLPLQYVKGLNPIVTLFDTHSAKDDVFTRDVQSNLHKVMALHLLSIVAGILGNQFSRLLLQTLYPILRSLISDDIYVSSTGLASLHYIAFVTGYASPSNLLLANFDYALDGVGRRLDRRNLDPEATKIFVVLIRLVGKDIVQRASDVVEACFDRLDEYHGYTVIVEGLVEVLAEVVQAIEVNYEPVEVSIKKQPPEKMDYMQTFAEWYKGRNEDFEDQEDYGPAPRKDWSTLSEGKKDKGKGKEFDDSPPEDVSAMNTTDEKQLTPTQALTEQIVSHSIFFLTHPSPLIRARILGLLDTASPTLIESAILPAIHNAWPYILNRLDDPEAYVVAAAASLLASLARHVGEFMGSKMWKDVWPRFMKILNKLEAADSQNALARRRGHGSVGTESAYTHSHRLYRSLLHTMISVGKGMTIRNDILWEICRAFRRFLHVHAHPELQACARELYSVLSVDNYDVVWLILCATVGKGVTNSDDDDDIELGNLAFLKEDKWDIEENARIVLNEK